MDLIQRIERLERENKRLKLAVLTVLVLVGAVFLLGASSPATKGKVAKFNEVHANRIYLSSDGGNKQAELKPDGLLIYESSDYYWGTSLIAKGVVVGRQNKTDQSNQDMVTILPSHMEMKGNSPYLTIQDTGGSAAVLGAISVDNTDTGAKTQYPASTLSMLKNGNVKYRIP